MIMMKACSLPTSAWQSGGGGPPPHCWRRPPPLSRSHRQGTAHGETCCCTLHWPEEKVNHRSPLWFALPYHWWCWWLCPAAWWTAWRPAAWRWCPPARTCRPSDSLGTGGTPSGRWYCAPAPCTDSYGMVQSEKNKNFKILTERGGLRIRWILISLMSYMVQFVQKNKK